MDEFERIEALRARFAGTGRDAVVDIGDDGTVLPATPRSQVLSVDTAVEGVHFRWTFGPVAALARRAAVAALSDLAAMGASPRAMLSALILAADVDDARFLAIADGLGQASEAYAAPIVGGNLSRGGETSLTTTVVGQLTGPALTRGGARVGDDVYVTGTVGGAALGLRALLAGRTDGPLTPFVAAWLTPHARFELVPRLLAHATAAIDVSDGVVQDLGHLCKASRLRAHLELDRLPLPEGMQAAAQALGADAEVLAATGGEDYQILFSAPPSTPVEGWATRIGGLRDDGAPGVTVTRGGRAVEALATGFGHFGRPSGRPVAQPR